MALSCSFSVVSLPVVRTEHRTARQQMVVLIRAGIFLIAHGANWFNCTNSTRTNDEATTNHTHESKYRHSNKQQQHALMNSLIEKRAKDKQQQENGRGG